MRKQKRMEIERVGESLPVFSSRYIYCDCVPVEGHRKSLQITRKPDEIFAYCHRCHSTHRKKLGLMRHTGKQKRTGKRVPERGLKGTSDRKNWPPSFQVWTKWITDEEIQRYGIEYVPQENALRIPTQSGVMWRYLDPKRYIFDGERGDVFVAGNPAADVWVLCEDFMSAIVLSRHGVFALALLGVTMKESATALLAHYRPQKVLVWLDNDNEQVKKQQRKCVKQVQSMGIPAQIVLDTPGIDPKEVANIEIQEILAKYVGTIF